MTFSSSPRYLPKYQALPRPVTAVPSEAAYGELVAAHSHDWVQLPYASEGAVARALGYASPSAFTSLFRRLLGRTPQHYLAQ